MKFKYSVFSTDNNHYLFDGVSSNIFSIEESLFCNHKFLFDNFCKEIIDEHPEFNTEYIQLIQTINDNLMIPISDDSLKYWFEIEEFSKNFDDKISHLMIDVTEKCNLRCKYCIYSGHYQNEREHGQLDIELFTLKKSIKRFFEISNSSNKIVNFYGGEPFANFEAIQNAVEYIKKLDENTQIYITTNGTLLSEEICTWISNNKNIQIYVSFAGTPEIHDNLRVFLNGEPTYERIKNNLIRLKKLDKMSYLNRVHFIFNIFSDLQLIDIQELWEKDELFEGFQLLPEISFIDVSDDDGYVRMLAKEVIDIYNNKYNINLLDRYIELLKNKEYANLIVKYFDEKFLNIHRRPDYKGNIISGVCKPFIKKIFIDIHGNLNICENFTYSNIFGNINNKLNFNSSIKLLDEYKNEREKTCKECWASKICSLCFRDLMDKNGVINKKRAADLCSKERDSIQRTLIEYCTIMESDSSLLEHLNQYIVQF